MKTFGELEVGDKIYMYRSDIYTIWPYIVRKKYYSLSREIDVLDFGKSFRIFSLYEDVVNRHYVKFTNEPYSIYSSSLELLKLKTIKIAINL